VYRLHLEPCQNLHGLPTIVVVKKVKEDYHDEFQHEIETYHRLNDLQGLAIPTFFGQGTFNDSPIIIMSEVVGITLRKLAHSSLSVCLEELQHRLEKPMVLLHSHGAEIFR